MSETDIKVTNINDQTLANTIPVQVGNNIYNLRVLSSEEFAGLDWEESNSVEDD